MRETEKLDPELVRQALEGFDQAFDHLTASEKREFLQLLLSKVVIHTDRIELELYDGKRALACLETSSQQRKTPGVNQGFVAGVKWLRMPLIYSGDEDL